MADPDEVVPDAGIDPEPEAILAETPLAPDDRPAKNVLAEMNRKYTKIERQNAEILAAFQSFQQQRAAPPPPAPAAGTGADYSDEQLGQLAAAGNAEAIRLLVERHTQRATAAQMGQFTQTQTVARALGELFTRYPVLRDDPSHPLTQAVYTARNQFLASGWPPGPQTDLEAIKAAIVNAPHLVPAPPGTGPQDLTRRAGVTAQQSMEGAASRRSPQPTQTQDGRPLDKTVLAIAQRMHVKDPQHSLKRFMERNQAGRSTVSPTITQAVREEGQA